MEALYCAMALRGQATPFDALTSKRKAGTAKKGHAVAYPSPARVTTRLTHQREATANQREAEPGKAGALNE